MPKPFNITNIRYGRLIAIKFSHKAKYGRFWLCKCDCGNETFVTVAKLNARHTQSCGCLRREKLLEHGKSHGKYNTKEYSTWQSMKTRCNNPNSRAYKNYGGRGISICARWDKFENFYEDMGDSPIGDYSIERIDNDKGYYPANCEWASRARQNNNTRRNVKITINKETKNIIQWLREYGVNRKAYDARIKYGWSQLDAITTPIKKRRKKK